MYYFLPQQSRHALDTRVAAQPQRPGYGVRVRIVLNEEGVYHDYCPGPEQLCEQAVRKKYRNTNHLLFKLRLSM